MGGGSLGIWKGSLALVSSLRGSFLIFRLVQVSPKFAMISESVSMNVSTDALPLCQSSKASSLPLPCLWKSKGPCRRSQSCLLHSSHSRAGPRALSGQTTSRGTTWHTGSHTPAHTHTRIHTHAHARTHTHSSPKACTLDPHRDLWTQRMRTEDERGCGQSVKSAGAT